METMRTQKNRAQGALGDAKQPKPGKPSCTCGAYEFPHRPGSGKCKQGGGKRS